jgi:hypothetical protein
MSRLDETYIENLSSWASNLIEVPGYLKELSAFCYHHRKEICEEIESFKGMGGLGKWALDLTVDGMLSILSYYGERVESMEVYYDESEPLEPIREMLDVMIGRKDKIYTQMRGKRQLLTFNLAQRIQPAVSREVPGLQIADVFAAAMNYTFMNPHDSWSQRWFSRCQPAILHAVFPDSQDLGVDRRERFVCYLILKELVRRSLSGEDLLEQIPAFISYAFSSYDRGMFDSF